MATFAEVITELHRQREEQNTLQLELSTKNKTLLDGLQTAAKMNGASVTVGRTDFEHGFAHTDIQIDFPEGLEGVEKSHTFGLQKVSDGYYVLFDGSSSVNPSNDSQQLLEDFLELMKQGITYPRG